MSTTNERDALSGNGTVSESVHSESPAFPKADENVLKNTRLLQVQPAPDLSGVVLSQHEWAQEEGLGIDTNPNPQNPWEGIELKKVSLNKHIRLSYVSEEELRLVVCRLRNIEVHRQKKFKKIIEEMQRDESKEKSDKYSSRIVVEQDASSYAIVFLDFSRYLKSIFHRPTLRILEAVDLVYPQGALMQWAFRSLSGNRSDKNKEKLQAEYSFLTKFDFTVNLFSILDEYYCSIFLLGDIPVLLSCVEEVLNTSFNKIRILGRSILRYRSPIDNIRKVINKSSPTLLLIANKAHVGEFMNSKDSIKSHLILDYPEAMVDFSGQHRFKKRKRIKNILASISLLFPWYWPKLICIFFFLIKILFSSITSARKSR